jgi:hypothetical protein
MDWLCFSYEEYYRRDQFDKNFINFVRIFEDTALDCISRLRGLQKSGKPFKLSSAQAHEEGDRRVSFLHEFRCFIKIFYLIDHNLTNIGFEQQSATKWLNINNRG